MVLQDEEEMIIKYIVEPKKGQDVISIIGMPGLGKTTLARNIFYNKRIEEEFPTRIWVPPLKKGFKIRELFLHVVGESPAAAATLNHQEIKKKARERLEKNKFLLVLDDVWSIEHWESIKNVLPKGEGISGKDVITSREQEVGMQVNTARNPHLLRLLASEESWQLLQLKVFEDLESCPTQLEDIGCRIAEQCGGVPLTVLMIGKILRDMTLKIRPDSIALEPKWTKVSNNIGRILQSDEGNHISAVVGPSYSRLRYDLINCFLYLGVFPENHEISASTLIQLWIAEGFIKHRDNQSLEESAEKYLSCLIDNNLLLVGKKMLDRVKTCRVPNIIHAFCRSKALEQNLFQVVKQSRNDEHHHDSEVQELRRLCLHSDLSVFLSEKSIDYTKVRSFLYFSNESATSDTNKDDVTSTIHDAFSLIRVFDFKPIKLRRMFLGKLTLLTNLRYITLSIDTLQFIPKQVSQLLNLQTLVIETDSPSITMKANLWKMGRLRHLKTKAEIVLDNKKWKGKAGGNLQTLSRLSSESCTSAVLERVCKLKQLGICGKFSCPENLEPMSKMTNLKTLTLSATSLDWKYMSTLAKIPTLEVLKLKNNAFEGDIWVANGDGFKCLQFLLITDTNLKSWTDPTGDHFPKLRYLMLHKCKKLQEIPECLATNLEKLEIDCVSREATEPAARKIEQVKQEAEGKRKLKWGDPFELKICPGCQEH